MRFLYIFPHPDDESFGPAPGIAKQLEQGHEVYLLTLTKGGATKVRHKLKLSVEEMGEIRYKEMLEVEKVLGLTGMTVLDLDDSGLKHYEPKVLEDTVKDHILKIEPNIIVTYPVHGISGFHDHLVTHAIVKSVYCEMKDSSPFLKRLAFYTLSENEEYNSEMFSLSTSKVEEIDCIFPLEDKHNQKMLDSLACYKTYGDVINNSGIQDSLKPNMYYEIFGESHSPELADLTEGAG